MLARLPMPQSDPKVLAHVAAAIAMAAGLPADSVLLEENKDGSFTITVGEVSFTGTFDEVCTWGDQRAERMRAEGRDKDIDAGYDGP
jgi:hypothetical protein